MMAETVVYCREFLFIKETVPEGRARQDSVHARLASAGHGRLARLLGEDDPDALRHARRQPVLGPGERPGRVRVAASARARSARTSRRNRATSSPSSRATSRSRTRDVARPHLAVPVRHGPAVPRELRRLRHEEELRVDARRGRSRTSCTRRRSRSRRSRAESKCPTSPTCCRSRSAKFTTQCDSRRRAPVVHPGRRPRRLAPAPGQRVRVTLSSKTATRGRTPCSRRTGPASASAPTSRR